jgi:spermidine synthase
MQRGSEFSIRVANTELMNSRLSGSEEAMATLTAERLGQPPNPRWLIGGLGMGFTLRAALTTLGPRATVTVAELVPAIIRWAHGPLASLYGDCLSDPRVRMVEGDVRNAMSQGRSTFDAILLDVDNGPEGLTSGKNRALYGPRGLGIAHRALTSGGVLSVWSAGPDERFTSRLKQAGFETSVHYVRATGQGRGARHVIWIARKSPG